MFKKMMSAAAALAVAVVGMAALAATPAEAATTYALSYKAYDSVAPAHWGTWVTANNATAYAGTYGHGVSGAEVKLTAGGSPVAITYAVHQMGTNARWLPAVTGANDADTNNGYAGNLGTGVIDAFMIKATGVTLHYQAHLKGHATTDWLPAVTGYSTADSKNGYAGNLGTAIDAIRIWTDQTPTTSNTAAGAAKLLIGNGNIQWTTTIVGASYNGWSDMNHIASTGHAYKCGTFGTSTDQNPNVEDANLLNLLQAATAQWKIKIGAISSYHKCDAGSHEGGRAVDLNGITALDGSCSSSLGAVSAADKCAIKFGTYLNTLARQHGLTSIRINQLGSGNSCGVAAISGLTGYKDDSCNHLHIGPVTGTFK